MSDAVHKPNVDTDNPTNSLVHGNLCERIFGRKYAWHACLQ